MEQGLPAPVRTKQVAPSMRRRGIRSRLRWSYLLSSTLPLLVVGTLLIVLSFRAQQENVYNSQLTLASSLSSVFTNDLSNVEQQILRLGPNLGPDVPRERLSSAVNELFRINFPNLREITIINKNSREVLRKFASDAARPEELVDRSSDPQVQAALQGLGQRGDIRRGDDGVAVFTLLLPLRDSNGTINGALSAEIGAVQIEQELYRTSSDTISIYLVNSAGQLMLSSSNRISSAPADLQQLLASERNVAQYSGALGLPVVGARGQISPVNWSVIVEQLASDAFATSWRSVYLLATLVSVVGLLALGWGLRQARQITDPLSVLGSGAATLGAGHLDHRIRVTGNDEFSDLAQTFNQMADHLQVSLAAIEDQNERLRNGLALARDIQVGLLPTVAPWNMDSLAVYARSIPAYEVGGDFYTYTALPEGRAAIAIGDISGKGVGAALLMALTSSLIETQARQSMHPSQVLSSLNGTLTPRMQANRMNAAVLYAVLDPTCRTLTVSNAGMIAPVLVGVRGVRYIDVGGLPLGSFSGAIYGEEAVELDPGDTLLFVTDGVVEAHNEYGELFGFERLEALLGSLRSDISVRDMVTVILDEVHSFMGDTEQHDDITLVAIQPTSSSQHVGSLQELELEVRAS